MSFTKDDLSNDMDYLKLGNNYAKDESAQKYSKKIISSLVDQDIADNTDVIGEMRYKNAIKFNVNHDLYLLVSGAYRYSWSNSIPLSSKSIVNLKQSIHMAYKNKLRKVLNDLVCPSKISVTWNIDRSREEVVSGTVNISRDSEYGYTHEEIDKLTKIFVRKSIVLGINKEKLLRVIEKHGMNLFPKD